jgi:hypothetical protein
MLLWFFDSKGGNQYNPTGGDIGVPSEVDEKVVTEHVLRYSIIY